MVASALGVLRDSRTYLRLLYLLLAFPLATTYFSLILTGLSVGVGLSVIGVGLGLLVVTMFGWILFGRLERELAIHLLGAQIRPFSVPHYGPESIWSTLLRTLRDPVTWKSLVYVLVEFPFGIFSFTLTVVLVTVALAFTLVPVAYLAQIAFPSLQSQIIINLGPHLELTGHAFGLPFLFALLIGAIGVVLIPTSAWALSAIGALWARFAEQMLGVDESRLQLAAAQAEAASQRSRAEQADQSRRELIVNASHELRTPVASISAHVESLLKPDRPLDDETRQYLGVVEAETQRLGSLVDDLLVLARADADELHLEIRPTDVAAVIDRVTEALAPLARRERNLTLVHNTAVGLPRVMADSDRLAQVLGNLIRNAVNNTPDGGLISVEAEPDGDQVRISVSDTGIGIEPDDLPHIFDRFYRTDESRTRDSGGSGLGLAIVRDLIIAMGGRIDAESTPGKGSVFRIWLRREAA